MNIYSSVNIYEETQMDFWTTTAADMEEDNFEIDQLLEDMKISEDFLGEIEIYI